MSAAAQSPSVGCRHGWRPRARPRRRRRRRGSAGDGSSNARDRPDSAAPSGGPAHRNGSLRQGSHHEATSPSLVPRERAMARWSACGTLTPMNRGADGMTLFWKAVTPFIRPLAGDAPWWLLLQTTGRRTGLPRVTPLVNGAFDGDTICVLSVYGERSAYVKNLRADPSVRVKRRGAGSRRSQGSAATRGGCCSGSRTIRRSSRSRGQTRDEPRCRGARQSKVNR